MILHRRQRRMWFAAAATILGAAALTLAALKVQATRDARQADESAGITATEVEGSSQAAPLRFRDVAAERGVVVRHGPGPRHRLLPEDTGSGLAWGDYNGDGRPDLYVVNFPARAGETAPGEGRSRLFRNDGGRFTDVTDPAGVGNDGGFGMGATWVDYDGDGRLDLFVTNYGGPNRLYRNMGDGTFEEVAARAGLALVGWSTGAAWGDFDRDGHIDLYVCNYVQYDETLPPARAPDQKMGSYCVPFALNPSSFDPAPGHLYRNKGDGTFEDVTERFGVANADGRGLAAAFLDVDGDGWLDLVIANDVSPNKIYRNMLGDLRAAEARPGSGSGSGAGAGKDGGLVRLARDARGRIPLFFDIAPMCGAADIRGSMGISAAELRWMTGASCELPSLFITHWVAQENALYMPHPYPSGLFEYRDKARQLRLGEISTSTVGWGCAFADFDLDGRPDLVVANGSTLEDRDDPRQLIPEPLFLFWNDGKQFQNVAPRAGEACARRYVARGLAVADFDDDGRPDVAMSVNRGPVLLLHNETPTDHRFLKVRLKGPAAACFGARVEVTAGGQQRLQWLGGDVSYLSMHFSELIFGLGREAAAEHVRVTWADGRCSDLSAVPAGRLDVAHPAAPSAPAAPAARPGSPQWGR